MQNAIVQVCCTCDFINLTGVFIVFKFQVKDDSTAGEPSTSTNTVNDSEEDPLDDDDDDELDLDELNELEASLSKTSIQIREPGIEASS